ncbi:lrr receptor-like serine threonine-protein kinase [Hordeum vulgare]|nr:lrr receptor-like serine threonine-protein kinase [Hordeum vulgare]
MADTRGDAGATTRDVVELQGPGVVTADVGDVHGGAGKLATAADVAGSASSLQKVKASSGTVNPDAPVAPPAVEEQEDDGWGRKRKLADYDPYEGAFSDDSEYEYDPGYDVYKGHVASFTAKEVQKIKAKGVASFYNRKFKKWHCPYCTTNPKPKDGRFDHLLSHAEDVAIHGEDYKIRGQHAALAKALTPA